VRAAIGQREEFAADVEQADLAAFGRDELAASWRNLGNAGDDMTRHVFQDSRYNAAALLRIMAAHCASFILKLSAMPGSS
jgi:hypothetical protein